MGKCRVLEKIRLDRLRHAAPQVFDRLRDAIVSLELAPGTVLARHVLAEQFGISQTPIRDALMRLGGNSGRLASHGKVLCVLVWP